MNVNQKLFIIEGYGKLAEVIPKQVERRGHRYVKFEECEQLNGRCDPLNTVLVHAGGGDQLGPAIEFCSSNNLILLQGSRNLKAIPVKPSCIVVNSSIFALGALQFIEDVLTKAKNRRCTGLPTARLIERRHKSDDWASGVTSTLVERLGLSAAQVTLETDDMVRLRAGVPREHLLEHIYFRAEFNGITGIEGVDYTIPSHQVYADGAIDLGIQALSVCQHLNRGNNTAWHVLDLASELNDQPDRDSELLASGRNGEPQD